MMILKIKYSDTVIRKCKYYFMWLTGIIKIRLIGNLIRWILAK